jgi:Family of unknown function (DUF6911)
MNQYEISWYIGNHHGSLQRPTWDEIVSTLAHARERDGVVTMNVLNEQRIGPLQVRTERGFSVLTLGEETESDYDVRSFFNPDAEATSMAILGDLWDMRGVCADFEMVIQAFKQFYETGDVSHELLN